MYYYFGGRFETKRTINARYGKIVELFDVASAYPYYLNHKKENVFYFKKKVN